VNLDAFLRIKARVSGVGEVRNLQNSLAGVEDAARSAAKEIKETRDSSNGWRASALSITAMGAALVAGSKAAIDFESSMSDVRKVVAGLDTPKALGEIKNEILALSSQMPITAKGFTEIYAAAGASGIARGELREFSALVAKVSTAFDMTAQEAGTALSQMRVSLGLTTKQVASLADAMNYVSDTSGASAAGLVEFMTRSGATGKIAGLTAQETMAFGAAMQQTGVETEIAATSFNNMIKALSAGPSMTDRQVSALNALGYAFRPAIAGEQDFTSEVEEQSRRRLEIADDETEKLIREIDDRYARVKQTLQDQWEDERDARERAINNAADRESDALQRRESDARKRLGDYYEDRQRIEEQAIRDRYRALSGTASQESRQMIDRQMDAELSAVRRRYRDVQDIEMQRLEEGFDMQRQAVQNGLADRLKVERRAARDREQAAISQIEARERNEQEAIRRQQQAYERAEKEKVEAFKKNRQEIEAKQKEEAQKAADAWKLGFSERLQKDGSKFLIEILGKISKLPKAQQTSVLNDLFGGEARGLPQLVGNIKALEDVLENATNAAAAAGSVNREYGIRSETTANQITLLVNDVYRLRVALGEALKPTLDAMIPVLRFFAGGLANVTQAMSWLVGHLARVSVFGKIFTPIVMGAIGLAGAISGIFSLAVLARWGAGLKILAFLPGPLSLVAAAFGILAVAASPLGPILNSILLAITAIQAVKFGLGIVAGIKSAAASIAGFAGIIGPALASASALFTSFVGFLTGTIGPAIVAFFSGPLGWTVLAVVAVTAMVIAFREPITQFLAWLGQNMKAGFEAAWKLVKDVTFTTVKWLDGKWEEISQGFNVFVVKPITTAWDGLVQLLPRAMQTAADSVRSIWEGAVSGIRSVLNTVIGFVQNAVNDLIAQMNELLGYFNRVMGFLTGRRRQVPLIPELNIPRFATGGYVTRPTLALVGEGGEPEHIVPRSKARSFANAVLNGATGAAALPGAASRRSEFGGPHRPSPSTRFRNGASMLPAGGTGGRSGANITINTRVDKVVRQDGEDRVTLAQAEALASDAARQAVAEMDRNLKSPSYRQQVGLR
jgi:hypothetical protein